MPLLGRKKVVLAKIETTYGTDSTPSGATNAILCRNLSLTPQDSDFADRNLIRPYLGRSQQLPTGIRAVLEMEVELTGSGTAGTAPQWGPLARACGHSETIVATTSVTYAPVSSGFDSATIYYNVDGRLHKMLGCRGTLSLSLQGKQIPTLKFTFTGIYGGITDVAPASPTYTSVIPLPVNNVNTTPFSFFGFAAVMSELSLDVSNSVVHRTLVGGSESVLITDRQPQGAITIEDTLVAQKDWWTPARLATLGALSVTHGTTAGNKVSLSSSNVQIFKPAFTDLDNVQMAQFSLGFIPSSAGNDEYSLVCT